MTITQDIVQRGHRERDNELNSGNVRKILKFAAKHDAIIAGRIRDSPKKEKYSSHMIQNEIITIFASMASGEIAKSIKSCKYFSILVDETNDVTRTELLSFVIRDY